MNDARWLFVVGRWPQVLGAFLVVTLCAALATGQTRPRRAAPKPVPPKTEAANIECPSPLGAGVTTKRAFCDVLTGRDPEGGIIVKFPPHTGDVTLTFDLHNRHTYSEELVKSNKAYRKYTATVGVLTLNNFLLSRFVIQNEFRTAADLVDRVGGGAGPGGVKAVAPTGTEPVTLTVAGDQESVSILGEKLTVVRPDATAPDNFTAPGRPIAIISNVEITYHPKAAPAPRAPAGKPRPRTAQ